MRQEVGLSFLYTSLLTSGTFRDGQAQWLVSARRGNIDRLLENELGNPAYRDAFFHVSSALGKKHRLTFNSLGFDDDIVLTPRTLGRRFRGGPQQDRQANPKSGSSSTATGAASLGSRTLLYATRFDTGRRCDGAE